MDFTSSISRYAFINAKLRSKVGSMIHDEQLEVLLRSKSVEQLLHHLEHTPYEPLIALYQKYGDIQLLESYLFSRHVNMFKNVASYFDLRYALFIKAMSRKAEVENLKGMIRLFYSKQFKKQNIDYRLSYLYQKRIVDEIDYSRIANADSFKIVLDSLKGSLYGEALSAFTDETIAKDGLFFLEVALDKAWLSNLRHLIKPLAKQDRMIIDHVLDRDADLKNIINLFRYSSLYHLSNEALDAIMIQDGSLIYSTRYADFLRSDPEKRSFDMLLEKDRRNLLVLIKQNEDQPIRQQILIVEKYLFSTRKKEFHVLLRGNPFSIGIVLSYLFLEERQDNLVRSLINGVHYQLESSTIREFVV